MVSLCIENSLIIHDENLKKICVVSTQWWKFTFFGGGGSGGGGGGGGGVIFQTNHLLFAQRWGEGVHHTTDISASVSTFH